MHEDIFENVIKYEPAEDDTLGGIPRESRIGLKTTLPPNPKAPAINPPKNPRQNSFFKFYLFKIISLAH